MLEASSHHNLNYQEFKKDKNKKDLVNFSPVLEKLEEYTSQSIEEQKIQTKHSGTKDKNNKQALKDSVISTILQGLDNKDNINNKNINNKNNISNISNLNRSLIVNKKKSLFNYPNKLQNFKAKKSLKQLPSTKKLFNLIEKTVPKKKASFNIIKSNYKTSVPKIPQNINVNFSRKDNNIAIKSKRKTMAILFQKKRSSQTLNLLPNKFNEFINIKRNKEYKKTLKEKNNYRVVDSLNNNNPTYITVETNQKLISNLSKPIKKQSGLSNSRLSDDFRFSSLIKKNKIQIVKGFSFKSKLNNNEKKITYIQSMLDDPNIKEKEDLIERIKIYAFIQSVSSLISILLNIIDIELFNKYSYNYIINNKIEYNNFYEIGKREINSNENITRILNAVFSFICLIMTIFIFFAKYNFSKREEEKILNRKNKTLNSNLNFIHEFTYKNNLTNQKASLSKLIIRSIINIIFYPPKLNCVFHSYSKDILCIYPINSFFLLFSSFKLYNIYRCIFYFIPVTATLGKSICQKHNVKLNVKFMFRTFLSNHRISFPFFIILILLILVSILLKSVERFSVDTSLYKSIESNEVNNKEILDQNLNLYDTLWLYLSILIKNPLCDLYPKTPFGKILLFIFYLFGSLFLCMIYYRLNDLMKLDRTSYQAYSKLKKLFQPENKENKASDVILAVILLKKYYSIYNIEEIKKNIVNQESNPKKRRTILDSEIDKLREKNVLVLKIKKLFFLRVKFVFFLKFFTDINNYIDNFKISRKHPLNISSMVQNIEGKMDDNLESINVKLSSIDSIDSIFERLKNNDNILLRKIQKIKKYDNSVMKYLAEILNYQFNNSGKKRKEFQTRILNGVSLKRSKTRLILNFKSCKSLKDP